MTLGTVPKVGLLGLGCAVPPHVRTNEDPVLREMLEAERRKGTREAELFVGIHERRYLKPGETVEQLMVAAGRQALEQAGVRPDQVERLYGYATVSEALTPNGLFAVHRDLRLSSKAMVLPINSEFSNFISSAVLAWEAIALKRCTHALVACGSNWTHHVDYTKAHSHVAGDGAGAAVIGPGPGLLELVDSVFDTRSELYEVMTMAARADSRGGPEHVPTPTYEITTAGLRAFVDYGLLEPPRLVASLLERHGLRPGQVTLITHQSSRTMLDHWKQAIQPGAYFDTFSEYGNLGVANIPVTLSRSLARLSTEYVVLISPGTGLHIGVLLLRRTQA
jgi:3-oxoacyl-[acyl-carrier-protein] synthase-3